MILIFFKNLFMDLFRQPLRTMLTFSGVVWGTFSIVLLLAFGSGVEKNQMKITHGMGEGIIIVWPASTTMAHEGFTKGKPIRITPAQVESLRRRVRSIKRISPEFIWGRNIQYKKENYNNTVRGVNVEFERMRNTIPLKGRFINETDLKEKRRVCFLGDTLARDLFQGEEPVGKRIFIQGVPFSVIGVMIEKNQDSNYSGQRDTYSAFIPHTTFSTLFGAKFVNTIIVQPWDSNESAAVIRQIREYYSETIGFSADDLDALFVWDYTEFERSMGVFFLAFNIFLGMIGSFTLLVGGVGVASIMLVVVEERIQEIGVKLAVGAKRRQILLQFFAEALTIIMLGGGIGFLLAVITLNLVPVELIQDYIGIPEISPMVGIVTVLALLVIGSISGLLPARKAASTNPIEALKG